MANFQSSEAADVILIGSGIMSSTLGVMLKCIDPKLKIQLYEMTDELAQEASNGWHNAGTGHAGLCELSYTPSYGEDGEVDVTQALEIFQQFEHSKQFWGYAVEAGIVKNPRLCFNAVPHLSFVYGADQVKFLGSRYRRMQAHHFFESMEYTEDPRVIAQWAPLLVEGRGNEPVAATREKLGSDVNFGQLAKSFTTWLAGQPGCGYATGHRVVDLRRGEDAKWMLEIEEEANGKRFFRKATFVFIGAGGGSLPLLIKSGIKESKGFGGFPIGGQWLVCRNPEIVARHQAKVYGMSPGAAPTMAVPHLDLRMIDGEPALLFGPYAAWTTKFLKVKGSWADLPRSIRVGNLGSLMKVGLHNIPLIRYLIQQGTQSMERRMRDLLAFYPNAKPEDWELIDAGIRVQAIKKEDGDAGIVHFGTEVVTSADGTISALLGASPGASVSVNIVLEVIKRCFAEKLREPEGLERLCQLVPTFGVDLSLPEHAERQRAASEQAWKRLGFL